MIQREVSGEEHGPYLESARRTAAMYRWRLRQPEDLVEPALAMVTDGSADTFERALVGTYNVVLYEAFVGAEGPERQLGACQELGETLLRLLARRYPDILADERADIAQGALERIWRARESCSAPVAFFAFAASHLQSAVQMARRQLRGGSVPLADPDGGDLDIPDDSPSALARLVARDRAAEAADFIAWLSRQRPRAHQQIDVLRLRCLDDLSFAEIADRLGISPDTAYVRLSRICTTIRGDPELARRARDLGMQDL